MQAVLDTGDTNKMYILENIINKHNKRQIEKKGNGASKRAVDGTGRESATEVRFEFLESIVRGACRPFGRTLTSISPCYSHRHTYMAVREIWQPKLTFVTFF